MMFWLQRKWLKIVDVIEDYWSWNNPQIIQARKEIWGI